MKIFSLLIAFSLFLSLSTYASHDFPYSYESDEFHFDFGENNIPYARACIIIVIDATVSLHEHGKEVVSTHPIYASNADTWTKSVPFQCTFNNKPMVLPISIKGIVANNCGIITPKAIGFECNYGSNKPAYMDAAWEQTQLEHRSWVAQKNMEFEAQRQINIIQAFIQKAINHAVQQEKAAINNWLRHVEQDVQHQQNTIKQEQSAIKQGKKQQSAIQERANHDMQTMDQNYLYNSDPYYDQELYQQRIDKRQQAYNNVQEHGALFTDKQFALSRDVEQVLKEYTLNAHNFANCYGNQIQHVLHQEFVDLVEGAAGLQQEYVADTKALLMQCSDVGRECNQAGLVCKAASIANFCWSGLQLGAALSKGAIGGAANFCVHGANIFLNPKETCEQIGQSVKLLSCQLLKLLYDMETVENYPLINSIQNPEAFEKTVKESATVTDIHYIVDALSDQIEHTSGLEKVEMVSSMTTEALLIYLSGRIVTAAHPFFKAA